MAENSHFKIYHWIWLEAHPDKTAKWLAGMMRTGFDIHHLDHDHTNNEPGNLILVEHCDHFMLHSGGRPMKRGANKGKRGPNKIKRNEKAIMIDWENFPVSEPVPCPL